MYEAPNQLSDLDTQADAGAIRFRAASSADDGDWQYRLYEIGPEAEQHQPERFLLVRVSAHGSVHVVASAPSLTDGRRADALLDRLWEALQGGQLPLDDLDTLMALEQAALSEVLEAVAPETPGSLTDRGAPQLPRAWSVTDFAPGDAIEHLADRPEHVQDPDDVLDAVVVGPEAAALADSGSEGDLLVQDLDGDDVPYYVNLDMVVTRNGRPAPADSGPEVRFQPRGQEDLAPSGPLTRIRANIAALRTLQTIRSERRPATPVEQSVLARWSSWGAVAGIFDPRKPEFAELREELRTLLSDEEWYAAEATTRNAHFTDAALVHPIWNALKDLGFQGGRVLEPGAGSGNFLAFAPESAQMTGVELDPVTAAIAAALYPDAEIRAESFVVTRLPEGFFDAAVGNVPFDEIALTDPVHNPLRLPTHNHFIVKSLELTRPGGLVAVLTSRYTLDSMGKTSRMEIADRADLVGAVRLPAGAHRKAAGTDAVSDLLIFRRRDGEAPVIPPEWVGLSPVDVGDSNHVLVNSHFSKHPEMVLGTIGVASSKFSDKDITVFPDRNRDLAEALTEALAEITRHARETGLTMTPSPEAAQRAAVDARAERMRAAQELFGEELQRFEGTLLDQNDGTFLQVVGGELAERPVYRNAAAELRSLLRLRDTYVDLLGAESAGQGHEATALRQQLNERYDAHTDQFGFLNLRDVRRDRRSPHGAFRTDPYAAGVYALEAFDKDTGRARKSVIFERAVTSPKNEQAGADNPQDALAISLNSYGEVRLGEIAKLLGMETLEEAREALGDLVFNEPGTQRLVTAAEYVSGNVREKLEAAERILRMVSDDLRSDHRFQENVAALRKVLPPDKQPGDIEDVQFGATWIEPKYYQAFLQQLLQNRFVTVTRVSGADWNVEAPSNVKKSRAATTVYGTERRHAIDLAQRMLRRSSLVIKPPKLEDDATAQEIQDGKRWAGEQTEQVIAKSEELNRLFSDWLWQDPERTANVLASYNRLYNSTVPYSGDGSHLTFPGLSDVITPRPHQRAGVARALAEPHSSFFDYEVGFGKTLTIAMTLMEMKRLGMVRKPSIVVKNATVNDFRNDFLKAYPQARVLAIDSAEFTKETAAAYIAQIANGDWDAIILPQSLFKRIPMSGRGQAQFVADQTAEYRARIHQVLTGNDEALSPTVNPGGDPLISEALDSAVAVAGLERRSLGAGSRETVKQLQGDLKRHTQRAEKNLVKQSTTGISWEQTGIDFITVDEVQDFANGEVGANNSELSLTVSAQAKDLKVKLRNMEKAYGSKVAIGSTGTPFPNAMPQAYVMLDYFRPDLLEKAEISAFSSFQAHYLMEVVAPEISPEGIPRIKERIGAFRNAKQFHELWKAMADVKTKYDITLPVPKHVGETIVVPAGEADRLYMGEIAERAEVVRAGLVDASFDNLLKISNDGRMAAMDLRMVEVTPDGPGKLDAAAGRIAAIYREFKDRAYTDREGVPSPLPGALQLVFADRGTASEENRKKGKFIAYDYLRSVLIEKGVPEDQIRYAQEARNAEEKAQLFADCRAGKVAVLIGSTETMGVGVNVQDRAIALHHIDCPWRPSDVTQREGRIVRQFNQHFDQKIDVRIFRWVKEGSFDSFMWQTVERKARFIDQVRTGRDLEEQAQGQALDGDLGKDYLEFGEIKAIATGNPLLLKKLQADESVRQLEAAYTNWKRTNQHLRNVVETADETLEQAQRRADLVARAVGVRVGTAGESFRMELPGGKVLTKRSEAADALRVELAMMQRKMRGIQVGRYEPLATVGGQEILVRINEFHGYVQFTIRGLTDVPQASFTVDDVDGLVHSQGKSLMGLVTRLENHVDKLPQLQALLSGVVDEVTLEIDRARKLVDQPFTKMDKLVRARTEQAQLEADIENQAGYGDSGEEDEADRSHESATVTSTEEEAVPATDLTQAAETGRTVPVPYGDRAEYYAGEQDVLRAYRAWAELGDGRIRNDTPAEHELAEAAERLTAESRDARASRLLGLEGFVDWQAAQSFAERARTIADQRDREQVGREELALVWAMANGARDHARRYQSTLENRDSTAFRSWQETPEPIAIADPDTADSVLEITSLFDEYTVTGPTGAVTQPVNGVGLVTALAQLMADGALVEETAVGFALTTAAGTRYQVRRFVVADSSAPGESPLREPTLDAVPAGQPSPAGAESPVPVGTAPADAGEISSSVPRVAGLSVLLGPYGDSAELAAGRIQVGLSVTRLADEVTRLDLEQGSTAGALYDAVASAAADIGENELINPAETFALFDQLAATSSQLAESESVDARLAEAAQRVASATERHLARMQSIDPQGLFDSLADASTLDDHSFSVTYHADPLREAPLSYVDSTDFNAARSLTFEPFDSWPHAYDGVGGEFTDQLRGALWQIRQISDLDIGSVLPDWTQVVAYALGASEEAERGISRTVLRDLAQRAFQHHQRLASFKIAASRDARPYADEGQFTAKVDHAESAWKGWLATETAKALVGQTAEQLREARMTLGRTAHEAVSEARYSADWATTDDGTLDEVNRQAMKLAHSTYALLLSLRIEDYQSPDDAQTLLELVQSSYGHASNLQMSDQPRAVAAVLAGVDSRRARLRAEADTTAPEEGASAQETVLEIEHHYRATVVRGSTNEEKDAPLRTVLNRHNFQFSAKQDFWYLKRTMSHPTRDAHVRQLTSDLWRLQRKFTLVDKPPAQATRPDSVIPVGEPYAGKEEAKNDFEDMFGALWRMKETPAGGRLLRPGVGARPDGQAVWMALEALRGGAVGSGLDPFAHPAVDVVDRCTTLAQAVMLLSQNLEEERYKAPVAMGHFKRMTQYATHLASRIIATASPDGLWEQVFSTPGTGVDQKSVIISESTSAALEAAPEPDRSQALPQPDVEPITQGPVGQSATERPVADPMVAGPYSKNAFAEAIEQLRDLRKELTSEYKAGGPEESPDRASLEAGFHDRWVAADQAGNAAHRDEQPISEAVDAYQEAMSATRELARAMERSPEARDLAVGLVSATESHIVRLALTRRTVEESLESARLKSEQGQDGAAVSAPPSAEERARKHAELEAMIADSLAERHARAQAWAVQAALMDPIVQGWFEDRPDGELRALLREWLRVTRIPDDMEGTRFQDWFIQSGPGAEDAAAAQVIDAVHAALSGADPQLNSDALATDPAPEAPSASAVTVTEDIAEPDAEPVPAPQPPPGKAGEIAAAARANGWEVEGKWGGPYTWSTRYELVLQAETARGARHFVLVWEMNRGRHTYNAQHSMAFHHRDKSAAKGFRPKIADVEREIRAAAVSTQPVTGAPQQDDAHLAISQPAAPAASSAAAWDEELDAEQETLFEGLRADLSGTTVEAADSTASPESTSPVMERRLTEELLLALPQPSEDWHAEDARLVVATTLVFPDGQVGEALLLLQAVEMSPNGDEDPIVRGAQIVPPNGLVSASTEGQWVPSDLLNMADARVLSLPAPIPQARISELVQLPYAEAVRELNRHLGGEGPNNATSQEKGAVSNLVPTSEGIATEGPERSAEQSSAPEPMSAAEEENVTAAGEPAADLWTSRIQIVRDATGTYVTGTGGGPQEDELRALLKKDKAFGYEGGRWRYKGTLGRRDEVLNELRAYLAAKDAQESAVTKAATIKYPPTPQQQLISDAVAEGKDVSVQALAGTGKTSTMLMVAERHPERRIAYVAFNRSIADEAGRKFGNNVTAKTSHGFAMQDLRSGNGPYTKKVSIAGRNSGARRPKDVAAALRISAPVVAADVTLEPEDVAKLVMGAIRRFRQSADPELSRQHLGEKWAKGTAGRSLLQFAKLAWADIADPHSNKIFFDHDDYLKIWALSNPRLAFDMVIFDEAQDINEVLKKVIQDQPTQTVVVGDSNQSIYEFRGAIDALKDWPADVVLPLTQSWRFGPAVAAVGNQYLQLLGSDLVLEGNPALSSSLGSVQEPDAILTRTNVGAIGAVFAGFDAGKRVALVGGGRDIEEIARAARDLQQGRRTKHPELSGFGSWHEVREYADADEDAKSLQMFVRLVDRYTSQGLLDMIRDLVPEDSRSEETRPELVVSTAHKAKGREWDQVQIWGDFPQPKESTETGELLLPSAEELRLAYVTVTRAKDRLDLGSLDWINTVGTMPDRPQIQAGATAAPEQSAPAELVSEALPTAPQQNAQSTRTRDEPQDAQTDREPAPPVTLEGGPADSADRPAHDEVEAIAVTDDIREEQSANLPQAGGTVIDTETPATEPAQQRTLEEALGLLPGETYLGYAGRFDQDYDVAVPGGRYIFRMPGFDHKRYSVRFMTISDGLQSSTKIGASLDTLEEVMPRVRMHARQRAEIAAYEEEALRAAEAPPAKVPTALPRLRKDEREAAQEPQTASPDTDPTPATALPASDSALRDAGDPLVGGDQPSLFATETPETAAGDESAQQGSAEEGASTLLPLPWNSDKIKKRATVGIRRDQVSGIPSLARDIREATGDNRARDVWEQDHPYRQFDLNLRHTLDDLVSADLSVHVVVKEASQQLRDELGRIAGRAHAHFESLARGRAEDPAGLTDLIDEWAQDRHPEISNSFVREALVLVLDSIDRIERSAKRAKAKPAVARDALEQVVGLAGTSLVDGHLWPHVDAALAPVKVVLDQVRELVAELMPSPEVSERYAELRGLIAAQDARSTVDVAPTRGDGDQDDVSGLQREAAATEAVLAPAPVALSDRDIAEAFRRFGLRDFTDLILRMRGTSDSPQVRDSAFSLPSEADYNPSKNELGSLYSSNASLHMTIKDVEARAVAREGKLTWAKALHWLRPALTSTRFELLTSGHSGWLAMGRAEAGYEAIGEEAHHAVAEAELRKIIKGAQARTIADALELHVSGKAEERVAQIRALEQSVQGNALMLEIPLPNSEVDADLEALARVRALSEVLPTAGMTLRRFSEVEPGNLILKVSDVELPFIVRERPAVYEDYGEPQVSISGDLVVGSGNHVAFVWETGAHPDDLLHVSVLPGSLLGLVPMPEDRSRESVETAEGVTRTDAAGTSTESPVMASEAASALEAEGETPAVAGPPETEIEPVAVQPDIAGASEEQEEDAEPTVAEDNAAVANGPYITVDGFLADLYAMHLAYNVWAASSTGQSLLDEARELREETGVGDSNEAAKIQTGLDAIVQAANGTHAKAQLLMGGYRGLLSTIRTEGRSLADRGGFNSAHDRELLLTVHSMAQRQLARLESTDDLQSLLSSENGGALLLTRYTAQVERGPGEEQLEASIQDPAPAAATSRSEAGQALQSAASGGPRSVDAGEATPTDLAADRTEEVPEGATAVAAPPSGPTVEGAGFDFIRDVIGDDLVVGGVAYDSNVWAYADEGGVRRIDIEPNEELAEAELEQRQQDAEIEIMEEDVAAVEALTGQPAAPDEVDRAPAQEPDKHKTSFISDVDQARTPADHKDLDRHFEDIVAVFRNTPTAGDDARSTPQRRYSEQDERRLLEAYGELRSQLSSILIGAGGEPIAPTEDPAAEASDAAALEAAMANAQSEASQYWGTPEWEMIRAIGLAAKGLRAAMAEAAGVYAETVLRDVRAYGVNRAIDARVSRAISHAAFRLAGRVERSGHRNSRGWRAVWGLHRAAANRADRIIGVLPAGHSIDLADQVTGVWKWLTEQISSRFATQSEESDEQELGKFEALIYNSFSAVARIYGAVSERIGDLNQTAIWKRVSSVFASASDTFDKMKPGVYRLAADRATLGTVRTLWVRTLELISHGAQALVDRLDSRGHKDGLRWNLLRALRHSAEDHIAQIHGHLSQDERTPLGAYEATAVIEQEAHQSESSPAEAQTRSTGEQAPSQVSSDDSAPAQERLRTVVEGFAGKRSTLAMELVFDHGIVLHEARVLLAHLEELGIVGTVGEYGVREILVDAAEATRLLGSQGGPAGEQDAGRLWRPKNEPLHDLWFDEVKAALDRVPQGESNLPSAELTSVLYQVSLRAIRRETPRELAGQRADEAMELYLQGRSDEVLAHLAGEGFVYARGDDGGSGWDLKASAAPSTKSTVPEASPVTGPTVLPKRQRSNEGDSAIAQAAVRTPQKTVLADRAGVTQEQFAAQADRVRARAEFAKQAATTPAEARQADQLFRIAENSQRTADRLAANGTAVGPQGNADLTADALVAALRTQAQARGSQIPEDLLDIALKAAQDAAAAAPRRSSLVPAPTTGGEKVPTGRKATSNEEAQHRTQNRMAAPGGAKR